MNATRASASVLILASAAIFYPAHANPLRGSLCSHNLASPAPQGATMMVPPPIQVKYRVDRYESRAPWICSVSSMVADHEIAVRGRLRDRKPIGAADTLLTIEVAEYMLGSGPDSICLRLLPEVWQWRRTGQGGPFEFDWFRRRRLEIGDEAIFWIPASVLVGQWTNRLAIPAAIDRTEIWPVVSGFVIRPAMFRSLHSVRGDIQNPLRGPAGWKRRFSYRLIPTDKESAVMLDHSTPLPLWVRVGLKLRLVR